MPFGKTLISGRYLASPWAQTLSGLCAMVGEDRIVEMIVEDANCLILVGWTLLT